MKSFFFDLIAMAVVSFAVFIYLGRGLETIIVFIVGLVSIRQARRYITKRTKKPNMDGS